MIIKYEFKNTDFEHEISSAKLDTALKEILRKDYKIKNHNLEAEKLLIFIFQLEIQEQLCEIYEDEIKEYFEDEAYHCFSSPTLWEIETEEYNKSRGV